MTGSCSHESEQCGRDKTSSDWHVPTPPKSVTPVRKTHSIATPFNEYGCIIIPIFSLSISIFLSPVIFAAKRPHMDRKLR